VSAVLSLRVNDDVYAEIKGLAAECDVSINAVINFLLREALQLNPRLSLEQSLPAAIERRRNAT
jgi:hypothetical protein